VYSEYEKSTYTSQFDCDLLIDSYGDNYRINYYRIHGTAANAIQLYIDIVYVLVYNQIY